MLPRFREEAVVDSSAILVENAGEREDDFLDSLDAVLAKAEIPGNCSWELRRLGRAPVLVIRIMRFPDVRLYVVPQPYGVHLRIIQAVVLEPGWAKRSFAKRIIGTPYGLSLPEDLEGRQELSAFLAVIEHCVRMAIALLVAKPESRGTRRIRRNMA